MGEAPSIVTEQEEAMHLAVTTDIRRFGKYSRRIRVFGSDKISKFPPEFPLILGQRVIQLLSLLLRVKAARNRSISFFPNLHTLFWPIGSVPSGLLDHAYVFMSPKLSTLRLHPISNENFSSTIHWLRIVSPPLQSLEFPGGCTRIADLPSGLPIWLRSISSTLKRVDLQHFRTTVALWITIAALPSLISLRINAFDASEFGKCAPSFALSHPPPFPTIEELRIDHSRDSWSFDSFAKIFLTHKLGHLKSIIVCYDEAMDDAETTIAQIIRIARPLKLEEIELLIMEKDLDEVYGGEPDIFPHTLLPLLDFHKLRRVVIYPLSLFDLDNPMVKMMAHAWPELVELDIGWQDLWVDPPKVTLEGLIPLAQMCPHLRVLNIMVDATVPIPEEVFQVIEAGDWQSPLRELSLIRSPIRNIHCFTSRIATFLTMIFPKLSEFCGGDCDESPRLQRRVIGWQVVGRMIQTRNFGPDANGNLGEGQGSTEDESTDSEW